MIVKVWVVWLCFFKNSLYRKLSLIAPFEKGEQQEVQPHAFFVRTAARDPRLGGNLQGSAKSSVT